MIPKNKARYRDIMNEHKQQEGLNMSGNGKKKDPPKK